MKHLIKLVFLIFPGCLCISCNTNKQQLPEETNESLNIVLNINSPGRVFEGVGTLSAGAISALLIDYPEPQRSEILDFLFLPKFGIGFQHLKIEIGSGMNSTCGAEPSHVITHDELENPIPRGYEFWLASEAKKRNADIILDALPWGTPYWTEDFTTKNAADWVISFLDVAKEHYGLEFDYVGGCKNEESMITHEVMDKRHPNSEKVKNFVINHLRPALDENGYEDVQIVTSDFFNGHIPEKYKWSVIKDVLEDAAFGDAIDVIGYHYPVGYMTRYLDDRPLPDGFLDSGKRIWASEDFSCEGGGFDVGWNYMRKIVREYDELRITKSISWAPFTSLPSGFFWNNVGFIDASEPWSGYYEIWPGLWCVAHISQFIEPGWRFLDDAIGRIEKDSIGGVHASFISPDGKDWSTIIVTDKAVDMKLDISNMEADVAYVWKSDSLNQMVQLQSPEISDGSIQISLDGSSIYTFTNTTGQQKGIAKNSIPEKQPAGSWKDTYESYKEYATPKFWVDQEGTFEITRFKGENILQQKVPEMGSAWHRGTYESCVSYYGGMDNSRNVTINSETMVVDGYAEIGMAAGKNLYFRLQIHENGQWKLLQESETISEGIITDFIQQEWQKISFGFNGLDKENPELICTINGNIMFSGNSPKTHTSEVLPFLGSSYSPNMFKSIEIKL